jgi:hypothetical protein
MTATMRRLDGPIKRLIDVMGVPFDRADASFDGGSISESSLFALLSKLAGL